MPTYKNPDKRTYALKTLRDYETRSNSVSRRLNRFITKLSLKLFTQMRFHTGCIQQGTVMDKNSQSNFPFLSQVGNR